ncbi:MAG: polysaccharide biosynthesis/export family protein, partial [bacterium]
MKLIRILVLIFVFFLIENRVVAQGVTPYRQAQQKQEETIQLPKDIDIDLKTREKTVERVIPPQQYQEQTLEKSIDSSKYILGPGDLLLINILGPLENQVFTEVTLEGYVVIPGIADLKVSGMTLHEGSDYIKSELNYYFRDSRFSIRLMRMRKFRVYVVGEIVKPGTYFMRGTDRLSDLIELAQGISSGGDETRISIQHIDGTADTVDISDFYRNGIQ